MRRIADTTPEIREMMAAADVCLNCGVKLKYLERKDSRRNRGYCSLRCFYAKPPKVVFAERQYDKPIAELMIQLLSIHTAGTTAHLLGIERDALYRWVKRYHLRKVVRWEVGA